MIRIMRRVARPQITFIAASLTVAFAVFASCSATYAGIVSVSGVTQLPGPPPGGVHPGDQPPVPSPIVFNELAGVGGIGIAPAGGIPVDHNGSVVVAAPVESANVVNPALVSGIIPTGAPFESYLFHYDPADNAPLGTSTYDSTIVFSTKIIGVQVFTNGYTALQKPSPVPYVGTLEAGDFAVATNGGPPLPYYPGGLVSRGLEEDSMQITNGGFGIEIAGQADGVEIDQVRIFTAIVPEPATLTMAFVGFLGIMGLGRPRFKAARS
jgi:hypothetical protein